MGQRQARAPAVIATGAVDRFYFTCDSKTSVAGKPVMPSVAVTVAAGVVSAVVVPATDAAMTPSANPPEAVTLPVSPATAETESDLTVESAPRVTSSTFH